MDLYLIPELSHIVDGYTGDERYNKCVDEIKTLSSRKFKILQRYQQINLWINNRLYTIMIDKKGEIECKPSLKKSEIDYNIEKYYNKKFREKVFSIHDRPFSGRCCVM